VSSPSVRGWLFVAVQAVLLGALILLPGGDTWPTPAWLRGLGLALIVAGLALIALASMRLGPALTATPVPTATGRLITSGLYHRVRHPIYSAVLLIVLGLTLRSGSWLIAVVAAVTAAFFNLKATWEEARLAETYPDYPAYTEQVPRFVPRPWSTANPQTK